MIARVVKLVRRVRGDVDGLAGSHGRFHSSKGSLDLAFQDDERFLEIVAVRRRPTARRNIHIDQAIASIRIFPGEEDCVGVPHQRDVRQILV